MIGGVNAQVSDRTHYPKESSLHFCITSLNATPPAWLAQNANPSLRHIDLSSLQVCEVRASLLLSVSLRLSLSLSVSLCLSVP